MRWSECRNFRSRRAFRQRMRTCARSSISAICRNERDRGDRASMPLLEVNNLDKAFTADGRSVVSIDHLSLSIDEHEFVSIVGPSGCGKSTFLHIIGGFEPASGGEMRLNGRPIGPPGPDRGMMFQDLSLFPWLTAVENVAWPLEMKKLPKRERLAKAAEYLDLVHLSRFADLYIGQLSGGMKQRVALARLFALDPEVLLMDQPLRAPASQDPWLP